MAGIHIALNPEQAEELKKAVECLAADGIKVPENALLPEPTGMDGKPGGTSAGTTENSPANGVRTDGVMP